MPIISSAQEQSGSINLSITGIPSDHGQLIVKLYQSEQNYRKTTFKKETIKILNGASSILIPNIPYGEYAISVIHDKNMNDKMDFHWFGMPSEDAAASNNAKGFMGPPKYRDARFMVDLKNLHIAIEMKAVHSK